MKMVVDTVVQANLRKGLAWGMTPEGAVVLVLVEGSHRVIVEFSVDEALDTCVGGIYAAQGLRMAAAQAQGARAPASMLVDPQGVPLGGGKG
jgi:hypothetical protein